MTPPVPRPWQIRVMLGCALFFLAWAGLELMLGLVSPAVPLAHAIRTSLCFALLGGLGLWGWRNLLAKAVQAAPSPAVDS